MKIPPIHHFIVRDGHLKIDDRLRKLTFVGSISSQENAGGGDRAFQMTGAGSLNGNKFLAEIYGGALIHVEEDKPYHFTADLHAGTTHATADGALRRPFHLGQFTATANFSGASMADLYYLTGLVFPTTAPYRLSGTVTREGSIYHMANLTGVVGASDLHGDMVVDAAQTPPFVRATLASRKLDFLDLGPLIGAPPVHRAQGAPPAELATWADFASPARHAASDRAYPAHERRYPVRRGLDQIAGLSAARHASPCRPQSGRDDPRSDHVRFHARQAHRFVPAGCAQRRRNQRYRCAAE